MVLVPTLEKQPNWSHVINVVLKKDDSIFRAVKNHLALGSAFLKRQLKRGSCRARASKRQWTVLVTTMFSPYELETSNKKRATGHLNCKASHKTIQLLNLLLCILFLLQKILHDAVWSAYISHMPRLWAWPNKGPTNAESSFLEGFWLRSIVSDQATWFWP